MIIVMFTSKDNKCYKRLDTLYFFWKAKDLKHNCSFFLDFASWDSELIRTFDLP